MNYITVDLIKMPLVSFFDPIKVKPMLVSPIPVRDRY